MIINLLSGTAGSDVQAAMEDCDARYNKALEALTPEQLDLFRLPEGTQVERAQ